MKMTKVLALLLAVILIMSCTACGLSGAPAATATAEPNASAPAGTAAASSDATVGLQSNVYSIPDYSTVGSDVKVLRVSVSMNEADYGVSASGVMVKTFVDRLAELSGGKLVAQVYPGSQLAGTTDDILNGMSTGAFEMSEVGIGNWGDYTTAYAPMNVPFLFSSDDVAYKIMTGDIGQKMFDQFEQDTSMHAVGFMDLGMRTITNNTKEIHTPADLKGLKIRVQSDPIQMATFEALGASTMNVSFSELFTSLQQGLCDGQDNPVITNVSRKFYECQKYMTLLNHMPNFSIFFVSDLCWNQLTAEQQGWIAQAGQEASEASYNTCVASVDTLVGQLKTYGIDVTELTADERQQFVDAVSGNVWNQCKQTMGDDIWNALQSAVTAASK